MSKKNKNANTTQSNEWNDDKNTKYPLPVPEVANMDDVGYYPDDVLNDKISRLESERSRLVDLKFDPYRWEVELAYLRREQQIRTVRMERHEAYMRDLILSGGEEEVAFNTSFGPISIDNSVLN